MSLSAAYASSPRYEVAQCSVANAAFDGSGTIVPLFTAGPSGSRIDQIGWAAAGTTTAGLLKFYSRANAADPWRFLFGASVPAITASDTVAPWSGGATNLNWVLTTGAQVGIAPSKGETFNVHVSLAGDF